MTYTQDTTYRCKCDECGNEFDSSELIEIEIAEYQGAGIWKETVSPCCFADYEVFFKEV